MKNNEIIDSIQDAMEILIKSVGSTVAPEMRIEFIKESYAVLFNLINELAGEEDEK